MRKQWAWWVIAVLHAVSTGALFMRRRLGGRGGRQGTIESIGILLPSNRSSKILSFNSWKDWHNEPVCTLSAVLLYKSSKFQKKRDPFVWWLMKMSHRNLRLWHEFVPPAFMCLGAIIDFCVGPRRARITSRKPSRTHTHTGVLQY